MKKFILFTAVLLTLCLFPAAAFGAGIDKTKEVTITITAQSVDISGANVLDTAFALYRVADVSENGGELSYTLTPDFSASGVDLADIEDETTAAALAAWAQENAIKGTEKAADSIGAVYFSSLSAGLYLAVGTAAPGSFSLAEPFLIAAPERDGSGGYNYDVTAKPKIQLTTTTTTTPGESTTTPNESTTTSGEVTTAPPANSGSSGTLLKTGQLNWPVPVLGTAGAVLFIAGLCMVFIERKKGANDT